MSELDHIFHIALVRDWADAQRRRGEYRMSTLSATLEDVGFIHCSSRQQVERIGALRYAMVAEPVTVLRIDQARLSVPIRHENLDGGEELFPHIYGPLPVDAVVASLPVRTAGGRFVVAWEAG